jgi:hypothetical protein
VSFAEGREHLSGYQARDHEVVDYQMYELRGTSLQFRGPAPPSLSSGAYFTCVGAAQTFGCFCEKPFPHLLADDLGLPALNLGYGGAGPEFFLRHRSVLDYINQSQFLVLQVMSGRSQSNSAFSSGGLEYLTRRSDGAKLGANAAYQQLLDGPTALRRLRPHPLTSRCARLVAKPKLRRLISETRRLWIESYLRLLADIKVPTVLFWFSKRHPHYRERYRTVHSLFGEFPQLVNADMVGRLAPSFGSYVECVSDRGSPQLLRNRFTGEPTTVDPSMDRQDLATQLPWTHNRYYPSPEMHEDARSALIDTCRALLRAGVSAAAR